ncbi:MAG TPA: NAD(P)-dependent oxidoreductase [Rhizomicrobium sp.]|jgi:3-hydroxyisobutyrate dehydrogenase-like beta-hydroxyacid dehydrogenase|nr:NAD(P)-dependent oxidoreductase [Rhizomicrobium sp.]
MKIGFIGLGHMGSGIASNLLEHGHAVAVFNRTQAKSDPLVAKGAQRATSIAEACRNDVVFTMLSNDAAVEDVVYGDGRVLASLVNGAIHVSSSTISVALAARLAADHAAKGQGFVSAPVFGRPDSAAAGKLFIAVGGEAATVNAVTPLLNVIGQRTYLVSQRPSDANLVKLSGNFLSASVIESLGEAMALIGKAGIDRAHYLEFLTSSLFDAPAYKIYGALVAHETFEPAGFAAPLGQKDIRLLLAAADGLDVAMPFAGILRDRFLTLMAHGGERLDWSAIGGLAAKDAGIAKSS